MGFFTDTTLCIGCKACEVACKQWNQLPGRRAVLHRHVLRQHRRSWAPPRGATWLSSRRRPRWRGDASSFSWLMLSDVCKHCHRARHAWKLPDRGHHPHRIRHGLRAARRLQRLRLLRSACPFGVIEAARRRPRLEVHALLRPARRRHGAGLRQGVSHRFDPVRALDELRERAAARVTELHDAGTPGAQLYGADPARQPAERVRSSCCSTSPRSTSCRPTRS